MQLTLAQAVTVAATKYNKKPTLRALQSAAQSGLLIAQKIDVGLENRQVWVTDEPALVAYLATWQPGRGAKPGDKRTLGMKHSTATKAKISRSLKKAR